VDASLDKTEALTLLEASPDLSRWLDALCVVSTDGLLALDDTGRILYVNAHTEQLLGLPRRDLLRLNIRELIHRIFSEESDLFLHELLTGEATAPFEMILLQPGGEQLTVRVKVIPLFDESGIFRGTAISLQGSIPPMADMSTNLAKYSTLVECLPAITYISAVDVTLTPMFYSPQVESILGFTPEEILADPAILQRQLHPDDHDLVIRFSAQIRDTSMSFNIEYRMRSRAGQTVWIHDVGKVVRNEFGVPLFIEGVMLDITERRCAEEALKQAHADLEKRVHERTAALEEANRALQASEAKFRMLADTVQAAILIIQDGKLKYCNAYYRAKSGFSLDELQGKPCCEVIAPESLEAAEAFRRRLLEGEIDTASVEMQAVAKDGSTRWVEAFIRQVQYDGLPAILVTSYNVTERKMAEEVMKQLLRKVEAHAAEMEATISAIADGVVIYNAEMEIIRINTAAESLLELTPDRRKLPLHDRIKLSHMCSADGRPLTPQALPSLRALRGESLCGEIVSITRTDGRVLWLAISAAPIREPQGDITGVVSTFTDITVMRELQQRQDDFLHIVSHDLLLPLTVIHGHMQLITEALRQAGLDQSLADSIDAITRAEQRIKVMARDLVEVASLEGGQLRLDLQSINLAPYVDSLLRRLQGALDTGRITTDIPETLPPVRADINRLERILVNLLSNALKYSPAESAVKVTVEAGDCGLDISVVDRGRGIGAEDLPLIFNRFYRVQSERKAEGIGLGLYITKGLVEAHGGQIHVASTPGQGSTFTFSLPKADG